MKAGAASLSTITALRSRQDITRREGIDADPVAGALEREQLGHPRNPGLRNRIRKLPLDRAEIGERRDIDDVPALDLMVQNPLGKGAAHQPNTLQIRIEDIVPVRLVDHRIRLGAGLDARVVDQDVDRSEGRLGGLKEAANALGISNVQRRRQSFAPSGLDLADPRLEFLGPARAQNDLGACPGQQASEMVSESARRAGNSNDFLR